MLRVFKKHLDEKIADISTGKLPTLEVRKKIDFHKEGQKGDVRSFNVSKIEDKRWGGLWMVSSDLKSRLVFPIVTTTQHPDQGEWNMERKDVIVLELTLSWEKNISDAEHS